jgi:hypothetical protein
MNKSAHTAFYNTFPQENNTHFLANASLSFRLKSDFMALCSQITFLFQEKLPIIYANIRVWIPN